VEDLSPIVSTHWLNFMNNLNFCGLINFSLQAFVLPYHWPCTHPVLMSILQVNQSLVEVFTQRNFVADFFHQKLNFTAKNSKIAFCATFGGLRGNVHGSSRTRWKVHSRLPISAIELSFASCHGWGTKSGYWSKLWCSKGGEVIHRWLLSSENYSNPGLSRGIVCVILRLTVLI